MTAFGVPAGRSAQAVATAPDATATERLVGWLGRQP